MMMVAEVGLGPSHQADRLSIQISKFTVTSRGTAVCRRGELDLPMKNGVGFTEIADLKNPPPAVPREQVQYKLKGIVYTVQHVKRDEGGGEIRFGWVSSDRMEPAT